MDDETVPPAAAERTALLADIVDQFVHATLRPGDRISAAEQERYLDALRGEGRGFPPPIAREVP